VLLHKPICIDELGVGNASMSDVQKMAAYIAVAEILLSRVDGRQHALGQRCELLCPFVSNGDPGDPPQWEPYFLLKDPACYAELGRWMAS
jgi:hypothetical protein